MVIQVLNCQQRWNLEDGNHQADKFTNQPADEVSPKQSADL